MQTQRLEMKIGTIKKKLMVIENMRPGSLSKQYSACQKPGCCCVDPVKPRKHGPFHQLSYSHRGRSTTQFIRPQFVNEVSKQLKNYKRFKKLIEDWVATELELAKIRMNEAMLIASDGVITR